MGRRTEAEETQVSTRRNAKWTVNNKQVSFHLESWSCSEVGGRGQAKQTGAVEQSVQGVQSQHAFPLIRGVWKGDFGGKLHRSLQEQQTPVMGVMGTTTHLRVLVTTLTPPPQWGSGEQPEIRPWI